MWITINFPRELSVASIVLSLTEAWCVGWSVIDKFKGLDL